MFREAPGGEAMPVIKGPWLGPDRRAHPLPPTYQPNGAAWALRADVFLETGAVYMPPFRTVVMAAERSVDIDYEYDLMMAETLAAAFGYTITPPKNGGDETG